MTGLDTEQRRRVWLWRMMGESPLLRGRSDA